MNQKIKSSITWILIISIICFIVNLLMGYLLTTDSSFSPIAKTVQSYILFTYPWYHKLLINHEIIAFAMSILTVAVLIFLIIRILLLIKK